MGCCGSSSSKDKSTGLLNEEKESKRPEYEIDELPDKGVSILGICGCAKGTLINAIITARTQPERQEIVETPESVGIPFKSVDIMSVDGIRLSGWEMIQKDSDKLVIFNHPLMCNRYGSKKGFEGVAVNFLPIYKILYDAGYNIITYDQRAQGESDGGSGKTLVGDKECVAGVGAVEWQDFAGVMQYVNNHEVFKTNKIAIYSQCMGAAAVFGAWYKTPDVFDLDRVKCQFANQPVISYNMVARITQKNLGQNIAQEIDDAMFEKVGFRGVDPIPMMASVKVPVLFAQVRNDYYTNSVLYEDNPIPDIQYIYDACPTEKDIIWIGKDEEIKFGDDMRFDAYNYFNQYPEKVLAFFDKYMK